MAILLILALGAFYVAFKNSGENSEGYQKKSGAQKESPNSANEFNNSQDTSQSIEMH